MITPPQQQLKRVQEFGSQCIETTSLQCLGVLGDSVSLSPAGILPVPRVHICYKESLHQLGWRFTGSRLCTCIAQNSTE